MPWKTAAVALKGAGASVGATGGAVGSNDAAAVECEGGGGGGVTRMASSP